LDGNISGIYLSLLHVKVTVNIDIYKKRVNLFGRYPNILDRKKIINVKLYQMPNYPTLIL